MHRHTIRFGRAVASILLAIPVSLSAQEKIDNAAIDRIKDEGMHRSQVMQTMSWLTDVYGPRLTGSPTTKQAGDWATKTLQSYGLQNVHYETWAFGKGWSNDRLVAMAIAPQRFPLIAYATAWTPGTNGDITADVVYAPVDSEADFAKYRGKLRGRIVLSSTLTPVLPHYEAQASRRTEDDLRKLAEPPKPMTAADSAAQRARFAGNANGVSLPRKLQFYADEGAVAVLTQGRGDGGTVFVQSQGGDRRNPPSLPIVIAAGEHYGRLARAAQAGVPVQMELDVKNTFYSADTSSFNLIGDIPGTDPGLKDEVVMLGAHFDSWHGGTGATDNAAGSAVMMEAMRILKAAGIKPRRTIRIGLWTGEEEGLLGSRAYVAQHFGERGTLPGAGSAPTPLMIKPEQEKIAGYFNVDNGTGAIRGVYLQGNSDVAPIFEAWMKPFGDRMHTLTIRNTGGTDHLSFDAVGIPGFQFIQDEIEYGTRTHHSNMDTYERVQADDMMHNATVVAAFVYLTAQRDRKLPRKAARVVQ